MSAPAAVDPDHVVLAEPVPGSDIPVHLTYVPMLDGLYAPIGLRRPPGAGRFPIVLLASGNGGGGMPWIREAVRNRGYVMERLLRAGYAVAWLRYRAEVELGYHKGGRLVEDIRQGRQLLNRSPLEYEDEIAVVEYVKTLPFVDPDRVGLAGVSHGGEMIFKLTSEYHGVAAGVACEPANHEFLDLTPDDTVHVKPETQLRDIEEMQMRQVEKVRARINEKVARARIRPIRTPILVMGREDDHLQGIFRVSYDLLREEGRNAEWVSYDHPMHGYIFPVRGADGAYAVDAMQEASIDRVIEFFARHLK
ncbi:MAG: prolyl oligopeptidase family serine peptidase [Candidatus Rokubacteria bacterium]|nr:prolyl oligopeptidase family serine peptidase [Candidatus Rokubacteria bacterium]